MRGLQIPSVTTNDFENVRCPDLDLVFIDVDDDRALRACLLWVAQRPDRLRPCVVGYGDGYSKAALEMGIDVIIRNDAPDCYKIAQIHALEHRFSVAHSTLDWLNNVTQKLSKIQCEYDAIDTELVEARKLQQALVQGQMIQFASGEMSLFTRPYRQISGDMVGHFQAGQNHVGFFAIDVAGHGITAALLTARIAGMLLGTSPDTNLALTRSDGQIVPHCPSHVIGQMNALLFDDFETDHYFTCILGHMNCATGEIEFSQAGHPNPIIMRADGRCDCIGAGGLPVGLIPNAVFHDQKTTLLVGDKLILCSDGVTECQKNGTGDQLGDQGLCGILTAHHPTPTEGLFDTLISDLIEYQGGDDFSDDISGLMITYSGDQNPIPNSP
ncbi:MAG: PP2C family protein-serine/threonine phosphatase [Planktomarina sp.]